MTVRLGALFRVLQRDRGGALMIEMAFAMPVLALLVLGGVEVGRYVLLHQKLDRVASPIADLVSQAETISVGDLDNVFDVAGFDAQPFDLLASGTVVVSSVSNLLGSTGSTVNWQRAGGGVSAAIQVGAPDSAATLPDGFSVADGQSIIIAEVFFDYSPWIVGGITTPAQIYPRALFRPRYGGLITLFP